MSKYSFWCFLTGFVMIFFIQLLSYVKNLLIRSGAIDGDLTHSMLQTSLITVPIVLFVAGLTFLYYKK